MRRRQAVERERELASVRLREQSERFDQQLQVSASVHRPSPAALGAQCKDTDTRSESVLAPRLQLSVKTRTRGATQATPVWQSALQKLKTATAGCGSFSSCEGPDVQLRLLLA